MPERRSRREGTGEKKRYSQIVPRRSRTENEKHQFKDLLLRVGRGGIESYTYTCD